MHSITLLIEVDCYASIFLVCIVLGFILICYKALQIILSLIQIIEHHVTANMSTFVVLNFAWFLSFSYHNFIHKCFACKVCTALFGRFAWNDFTTLWTLGLYDYYLTSWSSRKYPYPPWRRTMEISRGRGHESLNEGLKVYLNFGKGDAEVKLKTFHGRVWVFSETKQCHKQGNGPTFCTFFMSKNYLYIILCTTRNVWRLLM